MPMLTRRFFVSGIAAASLARPARAAGWSAVLGQARALPQLHSLVVAVKGREVLAARFRGAGLDRPANVKSVSKSLLATLIGAAIERGDLPGVEAQVLPYLARRAPAGLDPRAERITIEDLLTMRSGLGRTSGENYGAWVNSPDWIGYTLRQPMHSEPGTRFAYSTGDWHLLGAVLAEATGSSLLELARTWLAAPLGIEVPAWTRDPQGLYMGGNNMALAPRGMLAFGEAMRTGGSLVVSRHWINTSWTPRTRSPFSGHEYGYGWFLARAGKERVAYARGYGGQVIWIVPGAEVTAAATSDPNQPARSGGHMGDLHALLAEAILPAAVSA